MFLEVRNQLLGVHVEPWPPPAGRPTLAMAAFSSCCASANLSGSWGRFPNQIGVNDIAHGAAVETLRFGVIQIHATCRNCHPNGSEALLTIQYCVKRPAIWDRFKKTLLPSGLTTGPPYPWGLLPVCSTVLPKSSCLIRWSIDPNIRLFRTWWVAVATGVREQPCKDILDATGDFDKATHKFYDIMT